MKNSVFSVVAASPFLLLFSGCSDGSAGVADSSTSSSNTASVGSTTSTTGGSSTGGTGPTGAEATSTTSGVTGSTVVTGTSTTGAGTDASVSSSSVTTGTGGTGTTSATTTQGAAGTPNIDDPLDMRLRVTDSTTPEGVEAGVRSWRIWGQGNLVVAPVFTVPLANCETLVCYTTEGSGALSPRVAHLDANDNLVGTLTLEAGLECRGLAAEPDGNFAALLWDDGADAIYVSRYDLSGNPRGTPTPLVNGDNSPTDFGIGESRLEYGDGRYGAYYHVHSDSGHEGDTLKWVDAVSGTESTGWSWGCSHSMSNLLRYHPELGDFLPACVTDCYPGTGNGDFAQVSIGGIYLNHDDSKVMDVAAGCNGSVAGELGGAAFAPAGYKLVFNAHQAPTALGQDSYDESTMNQDIGFASIGSDLSSSPVVWLTDTSDIDEADASIARWTPAGDTVEQYVVGWSEPGSSMSYQLARVDAAGAFMEGPLDVSALVAWGRRDDPFRRHVNQDVVWAWFDDAGSTTLHFARLRSGAEAACTAF